MRLASPGGVAGLETPMTYDVIIRGGSVVLSDEQRVVDIGVRGETIAAIGEGLGDSADLILDAAGLVVLPGLIDPHVHMGIPIKDTWSADDFTSGSVAGRLCRGHPPPAF